MDDQRMDAAITYLSAFFDKYDMGDDEDANSEIACLMDPGWINCSEGIACLTVAIRLAGKPVSYFGISPRAREFATDQRKRMMIAAMAVKHMLGGRL